MNNVQWRRRAPSSWCVPILIVVPRLFREEFLARPPLRKELKFLQESLFPRVVVRGRRRRRRRRFRQRRALISRGDGFLRHRVERYTIQRVDGGFVDRRRHFWLGALFAARNRLVLWKLGSARSPSGGRSGGKREELTEGGKSGRRRARVLSGAARIVFGDAVGMFVGVGVVGVTRPF